MPLAADFCDDGLALADTMMGVATMSVATLQGRHRKQRHGRHAEPYELMAIFGWSTMKEAARYTRAARQKVLAASAMGLLIADQKPNKTVPLLPAPQESGTKENANPPER